ncbi:hypothetical protein [Agarivorans aestuarii]|uniref:hypothetical protein n=1 Tax=Agarivorans aestuarii TaxID=1563703 RepID=UPI001C7F1B80|nr:hypothetical protein [Agarivorans aestuarii]
MHPNANPFEESKFSQTLLVDAFGQSYMFLPRHAGHTENQGELVNHSIDIYWAQSLLQNHSPMWGYQFDLNKLYFYVSGDYMASHKSEQQKIAWLSNGIVSGEVKVLKGKNFAPPPPSNMEGGMPVATLPESVVTRAKPAQAPLGQGGQSIEDIREALDLYCALPDGSPAASLPYKATLADGTVLKGMLDADGLAHLPNLKPNNVDVEFGEQPNDAAIAATRAEIIAVLNSIIAAERVEGAKIAAEYGELNALQKGASSIGSLLTGVGGALGDAAELTYNLIELGSMQGQLKRALNAGWDAYNVDDDKGWTESFASNWSSSQHQAYVKALGFDPTSITKENLTEAYEIASFISDDDETQTALLQFVKDFADAQHHTELTEMGGAAIFDIVLGATLVAITGGAGTAAVAANKVRHLDKLGGLFKTLAKQLKKKAQFKTKSGRTGGKVEQQIAKPAGAEVPTDAGKQKQANVASNKRNQMNPRSFAEVEKRLEKAREDIKKRMDAGKPAYKPKYSDDELVKMANSGATANDRFLVSIQTKATSDKAKLAFQRDSGLAPTWTTSFDQLEAADSDPELINKILGNSKWYDPKKDYVMHIIDRGENLDQFGGNTVVPTWENMSGVVTHNVKGHDNKTLLSTMNSDYQDKYAKTMEDVWAKDISDFDKEDIKEYASTLSEKDSQLFQARHEVRTEIGANAEFTGNGLTANTADGGGNYGVVETLSIEKNTPTLKQLQTPKSDGSTIVKTIDLNPIE